MILDLITLVVNFGNESLKRKVENCTNFLFIKSFFIHGCEDRPASAPTILF